MQSAVAQLEKKKLEIEGFLVRASWPGESLCLVFEQDTLSAA